jgi:phosphoglycolate/pyridoxal phosphate phosphatase family enzyme
MNSKRLFTSSSSSHKMKGGGPSPLRNISPLLSEIDGFVFDCDGVLWKGDTLIPEIPSVLQKLRDANKKIFFVTNNSTKSRAGYYKKFTSLGVPAKPEEIFSSSFAAALFLTKHPLPKDKKVYVVGAEGICEELSLAKIPYIGGPEDREKRVPTSLTKDTFFVHDKDVAAVVVGFDIFINYYKIQYAQLCLNENPDCIFIATNTDAVKHLTPHQEWAGSGSVVGAIKGCTGKEPIVVGKPSSLLIDHITETYGLKRERLCMVGDRLDTDILFGVNHSMKTVVTLSGVTTKDKLLSKENNIHPDYYVNSIADFFTK